MMNPETGTLEQMFEFQKQLQLAHNGCLTVLPVDEPELFWIHVSAAINELGEAVQEDNRWKSLITRAKIAPRCNREAKLEELTDAMHYLINAVLLSGCDYDEFMAVYNKKNSVLVERLPKSYYTR